MSKYRVMFAGGNDPELGPIREIDAEDPVKAVEFYEQEIHPEDFDIEELHSIEIARTVWLVEAEEDPTDWCAPHNRWVVVAQ